VASRRTIEAKQWISACRTSSWKGAFNDMRNDLRGPSRVLINGVDGTCKWDYAAKIEAPSVAKSCALTGDAVNILTGGNATVQLQLKADKLDGTFQARNGNTFHVSFTKQ
jgi:hypothetical protein